MDPAIWASVIGGIAAVITTIITRSSNRIEGSLRDLRTENNEQHKDSSRKIDDLQATTNNTNLKVAVIETELNHVKKTTDRNEQYIHERRLERPPE